MGVAQGKKVSPPPLRHRRSRRSRPSARSSHQRRRGPPGSDSHQGEHVADIARSAQEATSIGRRKRNASVEMGSPLVAVQTSESAPASRCLVNRGRGVACRQARQQNVLDQDATIGFASSPLDARHDAAICLVRVRQGGEWPHASGNARPASFGADRVMRANAIAATMIAPAIPMASRQASTGTMSRESPCAA